MSEVDCVGSSAGSETGSDEGSPLGPKGGGTLKTCAICLEDYKYVFLSHLCMLFASVWLNHCLPVCMILTSNIPMMQHKPFL